MKEDRVGEAANPGLPGIIDVNDPGDLGGLVMLKTKQPSTIRRIGCTLTARRLMTRGWAGA